MIKLIYVYSFICLMISIALTKRLGANNCYYVGNASYTGVCISDGYMHCLELRKYRNGQKFMCNDCAIDLYVSSINTSSGITCTNMAKGNQCTCSSSYGDMNDIPDTYVNW